MATATVTRTGRTWYGRPTYSVEISDSTGKITFHGDTRKSAELLAKAMPLIVANRPVGPLSQIIARELLHIESSPGQEWRTNF